MFPTASILIRAIAVVSNGSVTASAPSLGVLDARTYGQVEPPSVDRRIRTLSQSTGGIWLPAGFQVTALRDPSVQYVVPVGWVIVNGPLPPSTVIVAPVKVTPSTLSRRTTVQSITREVVARLSPVRHVAVPQV
jgi:hypothetical protein